ncbi:hypothetical protein GCM10009710_08910 [Aeromicrobium alkaliterrae]|uniref:S-layer homology domain-containing protein n=1 Tax=Aeromicrobium alkaliterrae TaxID=302168 RepID=A0ABP4VPL9_9ACTN
MVAGLALTLVPAVTVSASAAVAPAPPSSVRVDRSIPPVQGEINITWNASPTSDISEYQIISTYEDGSSGLDYRGAGTLQYTVQGVDPGESVDIEVRSLRSEVLSEPATLRATGLDSGPAYNFTDVPGNTFSYEIAWLSSRGITTGYVNPNGSRTFAPSAPVLREQMAAFLYRLADPEYAAPTVSPFADVPTSATFYRQISWLYETGISTGYVSPSGVRTFAPSAPVLREQMAAFLYRYDGTSATSEAQTFVDVPTTATFHRQIEWLAAQGISTGYLEPNGQKTFRGGQPVLREQMAAFIYRYETGPFGQNMWVS